MGEKTADTNREVVRVMGKRDIAQAALSPTF